MNNRRLLRGPAFTEEEKQVLVCCILKEPEIENPKTDSNTNQRKRRAWERVTRLFNSQPGVSQRDIISLRKCWANMKGRLKKANLEDIDKDTAEGGILSLLQSSSSLIVTVENSSDGEQDQDPEGSQDSDSNIEYSVLDRSESPSVKSDKPFTKERQSLSPESETKSAPKRNSSKFRTRKLLARVSLERCKYIRWKREQKKKLFDLKIKTQQALLEEAIAKRDLAQREVAVAVQDRHTLLSNSKDEVGLL